MDPRHPEQAVIRLRDLLLQYNRIESDMLSATTTAQLGQLEREGGLVVQEICLVAPRIHEAMMQTSRQRRRDLSRGILEKCDETPEISMKNVMTHVEEPVLTEKPKNVKTGKKKTTKKRKAE